MQALEPFVSYDNFDTKFLDPDKWVGAESNIGLVILESSREIDWGRLHLRNRIYGQTNSDSGWGVGGSRLYFAEGDKVTAIKATVQVNWVEAKGCSNNPSATQARVRLSGYFFNTDTPESGSALNDVLAYIFIQRRSDSTSGSYILGVGANVYRCTNSNCTSGDLIGTENLGTISFFERVILSIRWDQANHRFIFQLNWQSPIHIPYNLPDISPPGLQNNKRIELSHIVPNCTGEPRPVAFMDAYIDKVFVNKTAAP
jgi:hypothetical protein